MPRRRLVVIALLLAGCGSSDETPDAASDATATASPTATVSEQVLERLPQVPRPSGSPPSSASATQQEFITGVFNDAEALWQREFAGAGVTYRRARLTIFSDQVDTACGSFDADVGPFYCPASLGIYLDVSFFGALSRLVGVRLGDFAQAYVVAHEVAHHVQLLLGTLERVAGADEQDPAGKNARSVRVELQADCFAGLWAHSAYQRGALTDEDIAEALRAAAVVGDDFLQRVTTGTVQPEAFTHGTSAQRQQWLATGFREGRPAACDTFAG